MWGKTKIPFAATDDTLNYWLAQDGLPPNSAPLCTNGALTPNVPSSDTKGANGVEVLFLQELATGHGCDSTFPESVWTFFLTHPKVIP